MEITVNAALDHSRLVSNCQPQNIVKHLQLPNNNETLQTACDFYLQLRYIHFVITLLKDINNNNSKILKFELNCIQFLAHLSTKCSSELL